MSLQLKGTIKRLLPVQSGVSARGNWSKQEFILEYQDGNYPAEACFSAWGQDRVDELARYQQGDMVKVSFNIKAREYSGRWYNDLRVWRITAAGAAQQQPAPAPAPAYQAPQPQYSGYQAPQQSAPTYSVPAPGIEDMPVDLGMSEDDLPF